MKLRLEQRETDRGRIEVSKVKDMRNAGASCNCYYLFHCEETTSEVGIIPGGLGIMRRLGRGGLAHVIQRIKVQVGACHVIHGSIVARLHGVAHVVTHAHGR